MILVDTSIWVEIFRRGKFKAELASLITNDQLCTHPFVVAELACGYLPDRQRTLLELDRLSALPTIRTADVRYMIETRGLFSKGIGFVDAQLIASCITTHGTQIWTIDRALDRAAEFLGLRAAPA
jgi:predicted nucleic acid-binding protein